MVALAAALLFALQDEGRLKEGWPKLVEAWRAIEAFQPSATADAADEFLKTAGKLNEAFESAGLYGAEGEYVPLALKVFIKSRARGWVPASGSSAAWSELASFRRASADPMRAFLDALARLRALEKSGLDDEDNVQDELATARKALKVLGVTADATPTPLRRRVLNLARALALGEAYPEPARATEEQAKLIRERIAELSHESIEAREKAVRELARIGEAAFPFLRETLKSPDAEAAARARHLLGIGHAPWTAMQGLGVANDKMRALEELKLKEDVDRKTREVEKAKEKR
jgi:hypothetical protein